MSEQITLREANQNFSSFVRHLVAGQELVITNRGVPVAKLVGISSSKKLSAKQKVIKSRLMKKLKKGYSLGGKKFVREDLYE